MPRPALKRNGFTLLEVIVAAVLLLLMLTLGLQLLVPSLRLSARGQARADLEQRGVLALARLTDDLLTTTQAAVSWADSQAGSPAVLALQPMDNPTSNGRQAYQDTLLTYTWTPTTRELRRQVWNPVPASLAITLSRQGPLQLNRGKLMQLPTTTGALDDRLISRDVKQITLASPIHAPNFGNPLTLTLELERKAVSGPPETFQLSRTVSLRNAP